MNMRSHALQMTLAGGVVAGALDIAYACVYWAVKADVPALRILQSVAAGLLGRASYQGGVPTAALGLVLHFLIALTLSLAYVLAARRAGTLIERPWLWGPVYGLLVYIVMNHVVVPLSAAPRSSAPTDGLWVGLSILVHMGFVGVPIALFARRAWR